MMQNVEVPGRGRRALNHRRRHTDDYGLAGRVREAQQDLLVLGLVERHLAP